MKPLNGVKVIDFSQGHDARNPKLLYNLGFELITI